MRHCNYYGKKKIMGGAILSTKGLYGIILYPALSCRSHVYDLQNYVSKIFVKPSNLENLFLYNRETNADLINTLRDIDPQNNRFIYATLPLCDPIPFENLPSDVKTHLLDKSPNVPANLYYFNMIRGRPIQLLTEAQFEYLGYSLKLLHENGIAHGDINMFNIVLGPLHGDNPEYPRFIDFGISFVRSQMSAEEWEKEKNNDIELFNTAKKFYTFRSK